MNSPIFFPDTFLDMDGWWNVWVSSLTCDTHHPSPWTLPLSQPLLAQGECANNTEALLVCL